MIIPMITATDPPAMPAIAPPDKLPSDCWLVGCSVAVSVTGAVTVVVNVIGAVAVVADGSSLAVATGDCDGERDAVGDLEYDGERDGNIVAVGTDVAYDLDGLFERETVRD